MKKYTTSERLKQIMKERNMKQVDILRMSVPYQKELSIPLDKSLLSLYVNGKSIPHQNGIDLLSRTLGVNPAWLMGYDIDIEENDITPIYNQLETTRKERVYNFAKKELAEQKNSSKQYFTTYDIEASTEFLAIDDIPLVTPNEDDKIYQLPVNQLMAGIKTEKCRVYPMTASAGPGDWYDGIEPPEVWDIPTSLMKKGVEFGIQISGESMMPNYPDKCLALVRPTFSWQNVIGKVAIVQLGNEYVIKEVGHRKLISHNKICNTHTGKRIHPDIKLNEYQDIKLVGEVMAVYDSRKHNDY